MWERIKNFARKHWAYLVAAAVALGLLIKRSVMLRTIRGLRQQLTDKSLENDAATEQIDHDLQESTQRVEELHTMTAEVSAQIDALDSEHKATLERIDRANGWDKLEALRQEGNKKVTH